MFLGVGVNVSAYGALYECYVCVFHVDIMFKFILIYFKYEFQTKINNHNLINLLVSMYLYMFIFNIEKWNATVYTISMFISYCISLFCVEGILPNRHQNC